MKCLHKYKWVKLPRMHLPSGKGLMGYWAKLASRAAFRKGNAVYCGHINPDYKNVWDLFDKLSLSRRRYYYLRENAFMLMSLILWAGPTSEISRWLEIIAMLEEMKMD